MNSRPAVAALVVWFTIAGMCAPKPKQPRETEYGRRTAPLSEHRAIIEQFEADFTASDYPKRLKMLKDYIQRRADGEMTVLRGISQTWDAAIQIGMSFERAIHEGLARAAEDGWTELFDMHYEAVQKAMRQMRAPPVEYLTSYDLLLEMFSIYSQLVSLRQSPTGSLLTFNKTVNDLDLSLTKAASKIEVTW